MQRAEGSRSIIRIYIFPLAACLQALATSFRNCPTMFNPRTTLVRRISADQPDSAMIHEAADVLRRGGLVAFPTETVYGLGANALDAKAAETIFIAKGRPPTNPIIVHVADVGAAKSLAAQWPEVADRLAKRFWPGSLTLVVPRHSCVPDVVTAGGSTVGIRVPAHPVALALLQAATLPIAAPSANRATELSPTTADHVFRALDGRVDLILDAGPTSGGLESTVIDVTRQPPKLLRPGLVSVAEIQAIIGQLDTNPIIQAGTGDEPARSPGQQPRHYAPRTRLLFSQQSESEVRKLLAAGQRIGWLRLGSTSPLERDLNERIAGTELRESVKIVDMPIHATHYAAQLYTALHELDGAQLDVIVVESPPETAEWLAIHDRLRRAAYLESTRPTV
jgi:L-threonylcarbamoyladenylate synthase